MCIYIYIHTYIDTYVYIERERDFEDVDAGEEQSMWADAACKRKAPSRLK